MKYRKKKLIEAIQWKGFPDINLETDEGKLEYIDYIATVDEWINDRNKSGYTVTYQGDNLQVGTLEDVIMVVFLGDWIIYDDGELFSCTPEYFENTYEAVE